jgi:L-2,4-diaminobutyrate decarboxylase
MFLSEVTGSADDSVSPLEVDHDEAELHGLKLEAFEPGRFRRCLEMIIDKLEQHLEDTTSIKGLALTDPEVLLRAAKRLMATARGDDASSVNEKVLAAMVDLYIKTGIQVQSPGYMGRQFSSVIPLAGAFDLVNSIVNQPSSFYEAGQLPNVAERIMAEEFNRFIGWEPDQYTMVTTSGGSLASLTAILAARNDKFPDFWTHGAAGAACQGYPAIAVGEDVHYSISRAAGILGIGEEHIVRLPLNDKKQICMDRVCKTLDEAKRRGLNVFCMVASAGTTSMGAHDPLDELAQVAQQRNIWLHVDGAHGASLLVSDQLRHKLKGIEKVDSFLWDAHKMMFVPAMCTMLFYKDKKKSYGAFRQNASYVFEKEPDIYTLYDSAEKNFECTKRPLIMNLWVAWSLYGRELFAEKIEYLCKLALTAYQTLQVLSDFHPLHQPESNILCFRYIPGNLCREAYPEFQVAIRNRLKEAGRFFISKVDVDGEAALRVVFMNHEIGPGHFRMLLREIRAAGQQLLRESTMEYERRSIA